MGYVPVWEDETSASQDLVDGRLRERGIEAFKLACRIVGSQAKMAKALGVSQNTIHYWIHKKKKSSPPSIYCQKIEELTDGLVQKSMLRPDLW